MTDQRTDSWFADRLGKVSASMVHAVMAKTKSGYAATRQNYMDQLIVERITGVREESFQSAAMAYGTEMEPFARAALENALNVLIDETGFVPHPTIPNCGASPDGLIGADTCVEIKVPGNTAFFNFLLDRQIDPKYYAQMQLQLACTGRSKSVFAMYNPRLATNQLNFIEVPREDAYIAKMEREIVKFLAELDDREAQLRKILGVNRE